MAPRIQHITMIGLGAMGTAMANLLLQAGYEVTGFDVLSKRMTALVPRGLKRAKSLRDAVATAELIMLSLPNWDIVQEAVEGPGGFLGKLQKGQIIADTTTVPPWETKAMASRLAKQGIAWLDVPISGAANQARVGNMVFMVGGKKSAFNRVRPVLDAIGKKTVHVGKNGDAAMLKLVVNHTLFLNQAAAIEGLVLGLKAGLDTDVMLEVMTSGAAGSDLLSARGRDMVQGDFGPKGPVWLAIKDLGLALESAKQLGVMLPMGGLYQQMLLQAHYAGWDQKDATVVMKVYEELAGLNRQAKT